MCSHHQQPKICSNYKESADITDAVFDHKLPHFSPRIQEEQMSRSSAATASGTEEGGGEINGTTASAGEGEGEDTKNPAHMLLSQLSAEVELDVNLDTLSV